MCQNSSCTTSSAQAGTSRCGLSRQTVHRTPWAYTWIKRGSASWGNMYIFPHIRSRHNGVTVICTESSLVQQAWCMEKVKAPTNQSKYPSNHAHPCINTVRAFFGNLRQMVPNQTKWSDVISIVGLHGMAWPKIWIIWQTRHAHDSSKRFFTRDGYFSLRTQPVPRYLPRYVWSRWIIKNKK